MSKLETKEDLKDKKGESEEKRRMKISWVPIYRFDDDFQKRRVFKILDTSFEGSCHKTPNTLFERDCVF